MKRWLKKYGKWLIVGLGILFIANSAYGIITVTEEWKVVLHISLLVIWVVITLFASGAFEKLVRWWEKD